MDEVTRAATAAQRFTDAAARVSGSAQIGAQGLGSLTVSVQGRLQRIELSPPAMDMGSDQLAAAIHDAYIKACENAVDQTRALISDQRRDYPQWQTFYNHIDDELTGLVTALHAPADDSPEQPDPTDAGPEDDEDDWPTIRG